jgi:hypothetical protein
MGLRPEKIAEVEPDAALGNGGLGRLAACFLDSMATMGVAGYGYGIRYEYGMFHQGIEEGQQIEHPDNWLRYGNPWEFPRPEVLYQVKFHGRVVEFADEHGKKSHQWVETDDVMAMAYDYPIPGYDTGTVNNMRLWAAKASRDFDLKYFNEGNYIRAVEDKNDSENLSKVLYPDDTTEMGRELRLKQQYFFVSASLQDMLYRFDKSGVRLRQPAGQGGDPAQRHPSLDRRGRADAHPDRPAPLRMAARLGHRHPQLQLHQPHADARGAGDLAGRPVRARAAAPPADHLRDQPPLPQGRDAPLPGRSGDLAAHVADRRERAASASAWPTWPSSAATR